MSNKNSLVNGFAIYISSTLLNKSIPFLILPILTTYLNPEEFGRLSIFQSLIIFAIPMMGMNMGTVINRNFFNHDKKYLGTLIFNLIIVLVSSSSFVLATIYLLKNINALNVLPINWIYYLPIIAFFTMLYNFYSIILRNQKKAISYGLLEVGKTILDISISLFLIIALGYSWEGRGYGILFAIITFGIISIIRIKTTGYLEYSLNKTMINEILSTSFPLIFHGIGISIISIGDRLILNHLTDPYTVGIYSFNYQFALIINLIIMAFSKTWSPWIHEKLSEEFKSGIKTNIRDKIILISAGYILISIISTIIAKIIIPLIFDEKYNQGSEIIIWASLGYAFNGIFTLLFPFSIHFRKTANLGVITGLSAFISIILNFLLIPKFGALGSGIATFVSYFLMAIFMFIHTRKIYPGILSST